MFAIFLSNIHLSSNTILVQFPTPKKPQKTSKNPSKFRCQPLNKEQFGVN